MQNMERMERMEVKSMNMRGGNIPSKLKSMHEGNAMLALQELQRTTSSTFVSFTPLFGFSTQVFMCLSDNDSSTGCAIIIPPRVLRLSEPVDHHTIFPGRAHRVKLRFKTDSGVKYCWVVNVYVPQKPTQKTFRFFFKELCKACPPDDIPVIFAGDFQKLLEPKARDKTTVDDIYRSLVEYFHLKDVVVELNKVQPTFKNFQKGKVYASRKDGILVSSVLFDKEQVLCVDDCETSWYPREITDHAAVSVSFAVHAVLLMDTMWRKKKKL